MKILAQEGNLDMRHFNPFILLIYLMGFGWLQGCTSQPETVPPSTTPRPTQSVLYLQITPDPSNSHKGWVFLGNTPVPVKFESGAWMFDTDPARANPQFPIIPPARNQLPAPPPTPSPPTPSPTSPPAQPSFNGQNSVNLAHQELMAEKIQLQRAVISKARTLINNTSVTSVDEYNIIMQRLERVLQELNKTTPAAPQP